MTVSTTTSEATFASGGGTTAFNLGFEVLAETDLVVTVILPNGSTSPKTLNVEYTVSNVGVEGGATVTLNDPLEDGEVLVVRRATPRTQEVSLLPSAGFSPRAVEDALDRMAMIVQEAGGLNDRGIKAPVGETINDLPVGAARAGKVLGFDEDGQLIAVEQLSDALVSSLWDPILLRSTPSEVRVDLSLPAYIRNASVVDFNALGAGTGGVTTGFYATSGSSTGLPGGEDGVGGHILALNYNPDQDLGNQLYFSPDGDLYIRGRSSGSFTSWLKFARTGGTLDGAVIGATTPAAATFTTISGVETRLVGTNPFLELRETDGNTGFNQSRIYQNDNSLVFWTLSNADAFISQDYVMTKDASGVTEHSFRVAGTERLEITNFGIVTANGSFGGNVSPTINATFNLGADFFRWNNAFLSNTPNVSSDARLKEDFTPYTDTDLAAARLFEPQTFRLKASGKPTSGYVAQQIIEAFEQAGLSPEDAVQRPVDLGLMEMGEDGMWGVHLELINALRIEAVIG